MDPTETLFRLALVDLPAWEVDRWWATGARDPGLVGSAKRHEITTNALTRYVACGVESGDDLDAHVAAGVTVAACESLVAAGVVDLDEQRHAARVAGDDQRHVDYFRAGILDPHDAQLLDAAGVTPVEVERFGLAGCDDPAVMLAAAEVDVSADDYVAFREVGVDALDRMVRLLDAGLDAGNVYHYADRIPLPE